MLKLSLLLLVPKSVILYLICARASLKQPRKIVATAGIQNLRNRLNVFISPLFLPVKAAAEMRHRVADLVGSGERGDEISGERAEVEQVEHGGSHGNRGPSRHCSLCLAVEEPTG